MVPLRKIILAMLFGLLLFNTTGLVRAQNPINARVDRDTLPADEQLVLTVTVTGDFLTLPRPDMSTLQDFVVTSSSQSMQVSIINGKMTSQGVFIYHLQPLSAGDLIIPPISVNIDGQLYQTEPIHVEVLPGGAQITPPQGDIPETEAPKTLQGQDFFVEAEVDDPNPYLGQQVIYTFRLYQANNFFGQPDYQPPTFTDFWSSEILAQPHYNTEAAGRNYLVTEILTAIFPANLGEITIEPARLVIPGGLLSPDVKLETNPVTVNVRPLPDNAPEDFNGAVGTFTIEAGLNQNKTTVNEPLTLVVKIEGEGNIETLTEPPMPDIPNWRFFDSQTTTTTETGDGKLRGARRFERLVVPGQAGELTFPPINFTYYDLEAEAYKIISTNPIPVTVLPDDSRQGLPLITGVDQGQQSVNRLATDIRHIKPVPTSLGTSQSISSTASAVYVTAWILPLFVMVVAFVWKKRQLLLEHNPAYARSLKAKKVAFDTLNRTGQPGIDGTAAAGRALLGYLSDKLNRPTTGLTTAGLVSLLEETGLEADLCERVRVILEQVEIGRYAPVSAGDERAVIVDTQQLINDLEKAFGK